LQFAIEHNISKGFGPAFIRMDDTQHPDLGVSWNQAPTDDATPSRAEKTI
jgi:hypothetical protein